MNIPDEDHVMRHVSNKRLVRDEDGNPTGGFLPQAFELRENEKGLSVNWLEYFGGNHQENIVNSVKKFCSTRNVGATSAFGVANVGKIKEVSNSSNAPKVIVIHDPIEENQSHSLIIRLPRDNLEVCDALACNAFDEYIAASDIP